MAYQVGFVIVHQKEKKKSINPKEGTKTHVVVNLWVHNSILTNPLFCTTPLCLHFSAMLDIPSLKEHCISLLPFTVFERSSMHPICDACLLLNTFVNSYSPIMVFKGGLKLCSYGHFELCSFDFLSSISILIIDDLKFFLFCPFSSLNWVFLVFLMVSNYHILVIQWFQVVFVILSCVILFVLMFLRSSTFY
jgi:hypothetical protein